LIADCWDKNPAKNLENCIVTQKRNNFGNRDCYLRREQFGEKKLEKAVRKFMCMKYEKEHR
jgi:hypothetical protein